LKTIHYIAISTISVLGLTSHISEAKRPNEITPPFIDLLNINDRPHEVQPPIPPTALQPQWWDLARQVGWPESEMVRLDFVIDRESHGVSRNWNRQDPMGGSRCLLQINGAWTEYLKGKGIIDQPKELFRPETCLRAGLAIYNYGMERYGFGWGPWGFKK
jgi:hypothetical protein